MFGPWPLQSDKLVLDWVCWGPVCGPWALQVALWWTGMKKDVFRKWHVTRGNIACGSCPWQHCASVYQASMQPRMLFVSRASLYVVTCCWWPIFSAAASNSSTTGHARQFGDRVSVKQASVPLLLASLDEGHVALTKLCVAGIRGTAEL